MWQVRESMEVLYGKIIADSAKNGARGHALCSSDV